VRPCSPLAEDRPQQGEAALPLPVFWLLLRSMDAFGYLSVLLSIILGLAVAQILQGYRAILLARGRLRLSGTVLVWSGLLLLFVAQAWWASFGLRERTQWDFISFLVILLQMGLLYMLAALIFPDVGARGTVDLVEHFERHRRAFFAFLIAMLVISIAKDFVLDGRLPSPMNLGFHLFLIAAAIAGILARSPRLQLGLALSAVAGFVLYVTFLFARLAG
jgi:hypothetical protein